MFDFGFPFNILFDIAFLVNTFSNVHLSNVRDRNTTKGLLCVFIIQ